MAKAKWNYEKVRAAQEGTPANFTWYETYTNVLDAIPAKPRAVMALAIIEYGAHGKEPNFPEYVQMSDGTKFPGVALQGMFEAIRINIENSVVNHYTSHLGGRKSKAERAEEAKAKKASRGFEQVPNDPLDDLIDDEMRALEYELNGMPDPSRGEVPTVQLDYEFDECPL